MFREGETGYRQRWVGFEVEIGLNLPEMTLAEVRKKIAHFNWEASIRDITGDEEFSAHSHPTIFEDGEGRIDEVRIGVILGDGTIAKISSKRIKYSNPHYFNTFSYANDAMTKELTMSFNSEAPLVAVVR